MPIQFIYFDLGKVLVDFNVSQMIDQVVAVSGVDRDRVRQAIFTDRLLFDLEIGALTPETFFDAFQEKTGTGCTLDQLLHAATDFFRPMTKTLPIVSALVSQRFPLGILSNTCAPHWEHCRAQYRYVRDCFPVTALSYELGCVKPHAEIYAKAAELAGYAPGEILFIDDLAENVEGARATGLDAVQYTTPETLANELRQRGIRLNY